MATAPAANPFQQFISGLFGNISSTPAKTTPTSSYAGPYSASYYGGSSPVSGAAASASKPATSVSTANAANPHTGANASYVSPANATASKGGVPFLPSTPSGGGQSLVPTQTSAATGKPSAGVAGEQPGSGSGVAAYTNFLRSQTPSAAAPASSSPSFASSAAGGGSTTSAPPAAPTSSAGVYGSAPGGYTGGSSGPSSGATDYRKAYTDMLAGLYDPDQLKSSEDSLDKIRKRQADAQLESRHEEARIRQNDVGQGLKSYNGQLTENSRKSSAELADLAIAGQPFQDYITQAQNAAKEIYGVGQDQTAADRASASDALTAAKFEEDKREYGLDYALKQQTEARLASTAAKPSQQDVIGQYTAAFTPGTVMADGTPTVDKNGFITPVAFKAAAAEAAASGIARKQFIELFGSQLYADPKGGYAAYGLTPVEQKLITGAAAA